jgi:arylsulfatase A-like enzyme
MESSGQWDKTWLIVSTDHAWRESNYYDGQMDLRVPFIVKAPDAHKAITYSAQFNTVLTHDLILAILRGELINQENVAPWLEAHPRTEPTIVGNGQAE